MSVCVFIPLASVLLWWFFRALELGRRAFLILSSVQGWSLATKVDGPKALMFLKRHMLSDRLGQESVWARVCWAAVSTNRQQRAAECKTDLQVFSRKKSSQSFLKSDPSGSVTHPKVSLLCSLSINHVRRTDGVCVCVCVCCTESRWCIKLRDWNHNHQHTWQCRQVSAFYCT